jgi:hypothetical protein
MNRVEIAHVKDHKALKLKVKEKTLEDKSGKWRSQTKDFDFIAGDTLNDNIFKKAMRRQLTCEVFVQEQENLL